MKIKTRNYDEIEQCLLNIPKFTTKNTLEDTACFLKLLGNPGSNKKIIHVAGTNGKGSVCAYLSSILTEAGYTVGMFTSPHLIEMRERFRINGIPIAEEAFVKAFYKVVNAINGIQDMEMEDIKSIQDMEIMQDINGIQDIGGIEDIKHIHDIKVREVIESSTIENNSTENTGALGCIGNIPQISACPRYHPTFFEFLFFMGMLIFQEKNVDYIILETGLGGRLDATNVIETPVLTVITEIGMDHTEYLGDTISKIAEEKAGILKPGIPVVFCDKRTEASQVILKRAKTLGNQVFPVKNEDYLNLNLTNKSIDFSFHSRYYDYIGLTVTTKALYQVENASIAARCAEVLEDAAVTCGHIYEGIRKTSWEGRMEEVMPGIFLEGAHNEDGIRAFIRTVRSDSCEGKRYVLFSAVADKDYASMIQLLKEPQLFDMVTAAGLDSVRSASIDALRAEFEKNDNCNCRFFERTQEAFAFLLEEKKEKDYIYIVGSLYLVGEIKAQLRRRTDD